VSAEGEVADAAVGGGRRLEVSLSRVEVRLGRQVRKA
jgi:hypothetical protein